MANSTLQIQSKGDARRITKHTIKKDKKIYGSMSFTGANVMSISIQWSPALESFFIIEAGLGWKRQTVMTKNDCVDYLWRNRKFINAHLQDYGDSYIESNKEMPD